MELLKNERGGLFKAKIRILLLFHVCLAVYILRTEQDTGVIFCNHVQLSSLSIYPKFGDILIILSRDTRNNIESVLFGEALILTDGGHFGKWLP